MALMKTVDFKGVQIKDAYIKVRNYFGDKTTLSFEVVTQANAESQEYVDSKGYSCEYDLTGDNALKQAYKHLKTLPEFEGAKDC